MKASSKLAVAALFLFSCLSFAGDAGALSPSQCAFFATNGETAICHNTGSAKRPYVLVYVSQHACVSGHAGHPDDYVAVGDPACSGAGSLPEGAPYDGTVECAEGLVVIDGFCRAAAR